MREPVAIVAAVIRDAAGRMLLVRKQGTSAFMQPGGKREPGEDDLTALARELSEEIACRMDAATAVGLGRFRAPAANEGGRDVIADVYQVAIEGRAQAAAEIAEVLWLDPGDARAVELAPLTREHILPLVLLDKLLVRPVLNDRERGTMAVKVSALSLNELLALIENHRRKGATDRQLFLDALAELSRRKGNGIDFEKSFVVLRQAAMDRRFVGYKSLAEASGVEWARVHYSIGPHLEELVEYAHLKGWPLLSAIVVNQKNVLTGEMEDSSLAGFIKIARRLGYAVSDERGFVRDQQARVFAWGADQK